MYIEILFTLIGEKCKLLNKINLSNTSIDDRICNGIYEYYRCYYGSNSCILKCIDLIGNKYITLNRLNEIFVNKNKYDIIISSEKDDKQFNLMGCNGWIIELFRSNVNRNIFINLRPILIMTDFRFKFRSTHKQTITNHCYVLKCRRFAMGFWWICHLFLTSFRNLVEKRK